MKKKVRFEPRPPMSKQINGLCCSFKDIKLNKNPFSRSSSCTVLDVVEDLKGLEIEVNKSIDLDDIIGKTKKSMKFEDLNEKELPACCKNLLEKRNSLERFRGKKIGTSKRLSNQFISPQSCKKLNRMFMLQKRSKSLSNLPLMSTNIKKFPNSKSENELDGLEMFKSQNKRKINYKLGNKRTKSSRNFFVSPIKKGYKKFVRAKLLKDYVKTKYDDRIKLLHSQLLKKMRYN